MSKTREYRTLSLRRAALGCLLLLFAPCALAAENVPGQPAPAQAPSEQPARKDPPPSPPAASPPVASPPSAFSPFVPNEKISAGKAVSFPNDI